MSLSSASPLDGIRALSPLLAACFALALGCGGSFNPKPVDEVGFLERAMTQTEGNIRVTAAVPSASETKALFGSPLYSRGIQPVWIEIENMREEAVAFLSVGLDPEYFSPLEAATGNLDANDRADERNDAVGHYYFDQGMERNIRPGETHSGFIFSSLDEGTKAFNVDVVSMEGEMSSRDALVTFTFFIPVPGLKLDHHRVDWENLYPPDQIVETQQADLLEGLEALPCCATDKNGKGTADPLNLVVIGDADDVYYSFIRARWDETETTNRASVLKTVASFFSGGEYRYSPVSSLYVFGRPQDAAFQKARDNIHERNHLRLWMTPFRFQGKAVWIGQISRDIGVRFTPKTITTHKIDPDVDETREFLLEDLAYSQALAKTGYVRGVGRAPIDQPRHNLTGDPYFTDGDRIVLWVTSNPVDIDAIEVLPWRKPAEE